MRDVTREVGLDFDHRTERTPDLYMPEMMSSGAALLDVEGDGDLDLYLLQGGAFDPGSGHPRGTTSDRLWRNDLERGQGLHFTDITREAGLESVSGYGMGAAVGDIDGDGHADLYLTRIGSNQLLRNRGDGSFEDVTERAGVTDSSWGVPATFFDFDRDGDLDLFLGNYIAFSIPTHHPCFSPNGSLDYCGPSAYDPVPDRLWRNRGDGTFEDVTVSSGLRRVQGAALGAVASDLDGDGWLDLYVANDETDNFFWRNRGDGTFEEIGALAGCAVNLRGQPEASMGIALADLDRDGDDDLLVAHLRGESNTLYVNDGTGLFEDASTTSGLGSASWAATAFGLAFFDLENDSRLDLYVANGAVRILDELASAGDSFPLHQRNQLFRNLGSLRFEEVSARDEPVLAPSEVSRTVLAGDLDNDGDTDLVVLNNNGPARLFENTVGQDAGWIGAQLRHRPPNTAGLGARVTVGTPDGLLQQFRVARDGSYAGAGDPRILAGLGALTGRPSIEIRWPEGEREVWRELEPGRYHRLVRGEGEAMP